MLPPFWSWDLDYVAQSDKWELLQWMPEELKGELDSLLSGTLVVWSDLDRVLPTNTLETDENAKRRFSDALDKVKKHIAMTFHRFIEDKNNQKYIGANMKSKLGIRFARTKIKHKNNLARILTVGPK